jgi:hypothetical protein
VPNSSDRGRRTREQLLDAAVDSSSDTDEKW